MLIIGFLIFLLLSSVQPTSLIEPQNTTEEGFSPSGTIVHDTISINTDDDFANQAYTEGWPGTGLMGDPYRIENLLIDASTAHGILIANTQVYFIISNCTIFGGDSSGFHGIVLTAVSNGVIRDNELDDDDSGISLLNSDSNKIENNTITECEAGMVLENSDMNDVITNNVSDSSGTGIHLRWCDNCVVTNNTCIQNNRGMHIERGEYVTIHNNTISGSIEYDLQVGDLCRWHTVTNNTCLTNGITNIRLQEAANATFAYNRMHGAGLDFDVRMSTWARLEEFSDNTVNGTPIFYLQEQVGGEYTGVFAQVILSNCVNVLVRDMVLTGTMKGISLLFCNDTVAKRISCISCYYGMWIVGGQRVTVSDCDVAFSKYTALELGWGDFASWIEVPENHFITNSSFTYSEYRGMYIGGNGGTTLFNNTVNDNGWGYNNQHQIHISADTNITIANNTLWGCWGGSANIFCYTPNSLISNNTCFDSNGHGIELDEADGTIVTHNICNDTSVGIEIVDTNSVYVANNTCKESGSGITFTGTNNIIAFNNCSDGGFAGIYFTGGSDNLIFNNYCMNNTGAGIYLWHIESINTVANNTCTDNTGEGILIMRTEWAHITNNTCADNSAGISLDYQAYNNSVYWNILLANADNAIDDGEDNAITNNFWSDYVGVDGDSDGIGDTPHPITGTAINEDPYPWMSQWFNPIPSSWMVPPVDQYVEYGQDLAYDLNFVGPTPIFVWISDTTHFSIDGNLIISNDAALAVGIYEVRVICRNMYGHHLFGEFDVIVEDTTAPTWTQTPSNQFVEYTDSFFYDLNATDLSGLPTYWVNDTSNFNVNSQGHVTQAVDLPVGVYGLELRATDLYDNYISTNITLTVTDSTPPEIDHPADLEFYENEGEAIYWYPTDDNLVSYQILKDGVVLDTLNWTELTTYIIWYVDGFSYGVGVFNYTVIVTDAGGNSVSDSVIVTILQELDTDPTDTITTTTSTTTTGTDVFDPTIVFVLGMAGAVIVVIVIVIKRR